MNYFRSEIKVGIFVTVAASLLVSLILMVGNTSLFKKTKTYQLYFGFTNGLEVNSPVHYVGVPVGKVTGLQVLGDEDIQLHKNQKVRVDITIGEDVVLQERTKATIGTLGLMGEKYIELIPRKGGSEDGRILRSGDDLYGQDPADLGELMESGKRIADRLEHIMTSVDEVLGDDKLKHAIKETFYDLNAIIAENKEALEQTVQQLERSTKHLEGTLNQTEGMLSENRTDIRELVLNLKETSAFAKSFAKKIDKSPSSLVWKTREEKKAELEERRRKAKEKNMDVDERGREVRKKRKRTR